MGCLSGRINSDSVTTEILSPPSTLTRLRELEKTVRIFRMDVGKTNAQWVVHYFPKEPEAQKIELQQEMFSNRQDT